MKRHNTKHNLASSTRTYLIVFKSSLQDEAAGSDDEQPMLDAAKDGGNLSALGSGEGGSTESVKPSDVDAFWLQRVLNKHYNDADISQVRKPFYLVLFWLNSANFMLVGLMAVPLSGLSVWVVHIKVSL